MSEPVTRQQRRASARAYAKKQAERPDNRPSQALHRRAEAVMHALAAQPQKPAWLPEMEAWFGKIFGPRPSLVRGRARADWDVAYAATLFSWGYFAEVLGSQAEPAPEPAVAVPGYAILGPDGAPVVEGAR